VRLVTQLAQPLGACCGGLETVLHPKHTAAAAAALLAVAAPASVAAASPARTASEAAAAAAGVQLPPPCTDSADTLETQHLSDPQQGWHPAISQRQLISDSCTAMRPAISVLTLP
jgi:hypothetical protein